MFNKIKSSKQYRFLFGIKYFNKSQVKELRNLFENKNFDTYSYKIFDIVKRNNPNKFTVITDDMYYNILSSRNGDVMRRFEEQKKPKNLYEFQNIILMDYISIEEILKSVEETFSGYKISSKKS